MTRLMNDGVWRIVEGSTTGTNWMDGVETG
jgi:hypothetical protein